MWRSCTLSWNPRYVEHSCLSPTLTPPSHDHLHLLLVNGLITLSTYTPLFVWNPYDVLHVFPLWVVFSPMLLQFVFSVSMPWPLIAFGFWLWICLWFIVSVFVFDPPVCSDRDFWKSLKKPFRLSAWIKAFLNLYTLIILVSMVFFFHPSTCLSPSCLFLYCFQGIRYAYKWGVS